MDQRINGVVLKFLQALWQSHLPFAVLNRKRFLSNLKINLPTQFLSSTLLVSVAAVVLQICTQLWSILSRCSYRVDTVEPRQIWWYFFVTLCSRSSAVGLYQLSFTRLLWWLTCHRRLTRVFFRFGQNYLRSGDWTGVENANKRIYVGPLQLRGIFKLSPVFKEGKGMQLK